MEPSRPDFELRMVRDASAIPEDPGWADFDREEREPTVAELAEALQGKVCNCLMGEWDRPKPGPHNSWCVYLKGQTDATNE